MIVVLRPVLPPPSQPLSITATLVIPCSRRLRLALGPLRRPVLLAGPAPLITWAKEKCASYAGLLCRIPCMPDLAESMLH